MAFARCSAFQISAISPVQHDHQTRVQSRDESITTSAVDKRRDSEEATQEPRYQHRLDVLRECLPEVKYGVHGHGKDEDVPPPNKFAARTPEYRLRANVSLNAMMV
jgi:hypothetical protein